MLKGKTKSGFEFEIDEKMLDDMELMEAIVAADKNELMVPALVEKLLGTEQKQKLYDHIRTKKGNVPIKKTSEIVIEIMNIAGGKSKNS